jgi:hypothetical protein
MVYFLLFEEPQKIGSSLILNKYPINSILIAIILVIIFLCFIITILLLILSCQKTSKVSEYNSLYYTPEKRIISFQSAHNSSFQIHRKTSKNKILTIDNPRKRSLIIQSNQRLNKKSDIKDDKMMLRLNSENIEKKLKGKRRRKVHFDQF